MSQIIVAYWSGTGNTEAMANAIGKGITDAGGEARVVPMEDMEASELKSCSVFALGCPAMGAGGQKECPVRFLRLGRRRMDASLGGPDEGCRRFYCR